MAVGDWNDTTDFWTGTPPILISAINCNTMFLNTYRLLKGAERLSEAMRFIDVSTVAGELFFYSVRITDDCPWDALTIMEKIKAPGGSGSNNLTLTVQHIGAELMSSVLLDCGDYTSWVWWAVLSDYDITGWAAGNHLISVRWIPGGGACATLESKCRHAMLTSTV